MNDLYTWLWIGWIGAFAVIEGAALINKDEGDTLSEHVWNWFKVKDEKSPRRTFRMVMLGGFLGWLSIHFMTGGKV